MDTRICSRAVVPVLLAALGLAGARPAAAQRNRVVVPANTVVEVRLDEELSSRTTRVGERFTATVERDDRSGFPHGTRFEGVVTQAQRRTDDRPGILDMEFRRVILPDGRAASVRGDLASLSDEDVRRSADGRLEARRREREGFDFKWVGIGAAAGGVLAAILGESFLRGALFGGLGGAIYAYINRERDRDGFREVELERGTRFGVRLEDRVAFTGQSGYRYTARDPFTEPDGVRVLGDREEYRFGDTEIRVNGRRLELAQDRPVTVNDVLYVPLAPIAAATGMRYQHRLGDETFVLYTRAGAVRGYTGEEQGRLTRGARQVRLVNPPVMINGEIYVPTEFLSSVAEMRVTWNRPERRLDLDSYR